jgi:uncharacterized protein (DUF3084 family)
MVTVILATFGASQVVLALLPVLLGGGVIGAVVTHRSQNRKTDAEANSILQDTYAEALKDLRDQMGMLRDDARGARVEAAAARASAAGAREEAQKAVQAQYAAETRAAEVEAALARAEHKAGEERHKLRDELAAVAAKRDALQHELDEMRTYHEQEIAALRDEIETLRARVGEGERRSAERRT